MIRVLLSALLLVLATVSPGPWGVPSHDVHVGAVADHEGHGLPETDGAEASSCASYCAVLAVPASVPTLMAGAAFPLSAPVPTATPSLDLAPPRPPPRA